MTSYVFCPAHGAVCLQSRSHCGRRSMHWSVHRRSCFLSKAGPGTRSVVVDMRLLRRGLASETPDPGIATNAGSACHVNEGLTAVYGHSRTGTTNRLWRSCRATGCRGGRRGGPLKKCYGSTGEARHSRRQVVTAAAALTRQERSWNSRSGLAMQHCRPAWLRARTQRLLAARRDCLQSEGYVQYCSWSRPARPTSHSN